MAACEHSMCFTCCTKDKEPCAAHQKKAAQVAAENAMLEAYKPFLQKSKRISSATGGRQVYKGEFKEEAIEFINDTVVIFCLRDFFSKKKHCAEVLFKQERKARLLKKGETTDEQVAQLMRVQSRAAWKQRNAALFTDKLPADWAVAQGAITGNVSERAYAGFT
eukprot:3066-Heterococcus_DN1.PRE.1